MEYIGPIPTWIILLTSIVGVVLIVAGVISFIATLSGRQKVTDDGDIKVSSPFFSFQSSSGGPYCTAILLGLFIFSTPIYLAINHSSGKTEEQERKDKNTPTTGKLEEGEHKVREEEIHIDLSNRIEFGLKEFIEKKLSEATWRITRTLKNVGPNVEKLNFRHATSGHSIEALNPPQNYSWQKLEKNDEQAIFTPFFKLIKGQRKFEDIIKRSGEMKTYYMSVYVDPISKGEGQAVTYKLKYYNAFQGSEFEWAGKLFSADTDLLTMHIIFPNDKPFKSFEIFKRVVEKAPKIKIENPDITSKLDNHVLTWKIRDAIKGEAYYIKWAW